MRPLTTLLTLSTFLSIPPLIAAPAPKIATVEDVRDYLRKTYPTKPTDPAAPFRYEKAKIIEVDAPALRKALPRTRFFVTKIGTKFFEYSEVETLISASTSGDKVTFRNCFSPIFTTESPEFLTQFRGLRAKSTEERKNLGEAIGALFQQITYKGEIRNGDFQQPQSHLELWTNKRHYRTIHFDFDEEGHLKSVTFENPVSKMKD